VLGIAKLIEARGISKAVAAKMVGVTRPDFSKYLRGDFPVSLQRLFNVARALGCDVEFIHIASSAAVSASKWHKARPPNAEPGRERGRRFRFQTQLCDLARGGGPARIPEITRRGLNFWQTFEGTGLRHGGLQFMARVDFHRAPRISGIIQVRDLTAPCAQCGRDGDR
jgi:transcriptional regulator with XRE-family HTH domain